MRLRAASRLVARLVRTAWRITATSRHGGTLTLTTSAQILVRQLIEGKAVLANDYLITPVAARAMAARQRAHTSRCGQGGLQPLVHFAARVALDLWPRRIERPRGAQRGNRAGGVTQTALCRSTPSGTRMQAETASWLGQAHTCATTGPFIA